MRTKDKKERLTALLKSHNRLGVALSGGVDSAFLLMTARAVLGDGAVAFTSVGLPHAAGESAAAARLAAGIGVLHRKIPTGRLDRREFTENGKDRCYHCKKIMWTEIAEAAAAMDIFRLADGVCADDLNEYRPGLAAGKEMGVFSPLAEAGLTKPEIRELAREDGLPIWDKPSGTCLATRIPYGTRLTPELLTMIERAEGCLIDHGFPQCRVRYHHGLARIEVPPDRITPLSDRTIREPILTVLKNIGFTHVALDLTGYVSGSMDLVLQE